MCVYVSCEAAKARNECFIWVWRIFFIVLRSIGSVSFIRFYFRYVIFLFLFLLRLKAQYSIHLMLRNRNKCFYYWMDIKMWYTDFGCIESCDEYFPFVVSIPVSTSSPCDFPIQFAHFLRCAYVPSWQYLSGMPGPMLDSVHFV